MSGKQLVELGTKICTRCKRREPVTNFYRNRRAKDGLGSWCKPCSRQTVNEYKRRNPEKRRQQDINWREKNPDKVKEYHDRYVAKNRRKIYSRMRRYLKNHPEQARAWNATFKAIKSKRLARPNKCSRCGKACKPQAHHEDYTKPLEVIWFCVQCHKETHKAEGTNHAEMP